MSELLKTAFEIEKKIAGTDGDVRYALHQELHRTLERIRLSGEHVPARLRDLDLDLLDEEVEDSFDNMPV